ncbi:MAG: zinc ribbon domain-containing protein [Deltaproteobacteria bacterium]|nr:zinc ribbon domain-containing protein [Deltaproteobacteria bacterium]
MPDVKFCQSCGMPLEDPDDHGTDAYGGRDDDYCGHCMRGGKFIEPDITMEKMIDKVVGYMEKSADIPKGQARPMLAVFMPTLKRWRK